MFQVGGFNQRCSFWAQVIYQRLQVNFLFSNKIYSKQYNVCEEEEDDCYVSGGREGGE